MRLSDALDTIHQKKGSKPNVFSIRFLKWNAQKRKGGEEVYLNAATCSGLRHKGWDNGTVGVKPVGTNLHPYPVHVLLILEVNGEAVLN